MTTFERGQSAVFARRQHGGLSEVGNSAGKTGKQQIDNLFPGRFVKDKIYEETSREYSTIMLMLVKDNCVKLGMPLADINHGQSAVCI